MSEITPFLYFSKSDIHFFFILLSDRRHTRQIIVLDFSVIVSEEIGKLGINICNGIYLDHCDSKQ